MLRLRAACSPGPAPRAARLPAMEPGPDGPAAFGPADIHEGWFRETCSLWPGQALSLQVEQLLHHQRSRYQDILVFRRYHRRPGPAPPSACGGPQPRPRAARRPEPAGTPPNPVSAPAAPLPAGPLSCALYLRTPPPPGRLCPRPSPCKTVRSSGELGQCPPATPSPPCIPSPWAGGRRFGRSSWAGREPESALAPRAELHVSVPDTSEQGP